LNSLDFSHEEVARATRYHRPRYYVLFARVVIAVAVLLALREVGDGLDALGWAGASALWAAIVVAGLDVVLLPLDVWSGWIRERRWGFSQQSLADWLADRAKASAIGVVLAAAAWVAVVGLARPWPSLWVLPAAAGAALVTLFLSFVAPVVLEPLFNRFRPLEDAELAARLGALAERAGAPVREVLVADASRRTTKVNAYVSGLGASRRVVVWDTLLAAVGAPEVEVVVAHELGHRRLRHVAKFSAVGMAIAAAVVVLVRLVVGTPAPGDLPTAVLLVLAAQAVVAPCFAAYSRRYERQADRFALDVTGDLPAFERVMIELARRNLSDVAPPRLAYLLLFTHPTAPQRLEHARLALARAAAS
jgi:Zn-dependent protease with chaperone function